MGTEPSPCLTPANGLCKTLEGLSPWRRKEGPAVWYYKARNPLLSSAEIEDFCQSNVTSIMFFLHIYHSVCLGAFCFIVLEKCTFAFIVFSYVPVSG